jgi:hypothetical protein
LAEIVITTNHGAPAWTGLGPRWEYVGDLAAQHGDTSIIEIPPGTAFEVDEAEGLRLVKRHRGEVVAAPTP